MTQKLEKTHSTNNEFYRLNFLTDLEFSKTSRDNFRLLSSTRLKK